MSPNLLVVFYKGTCGYCHKLINDPIEKTAAACGATAVFIDANNLRDCPLAHLYDSTQGVPQTNLVSMTPQTRVVGYLPQAQHAQALLKR